MTHSAIKVDGLWKEYVVGQVRQQHGTFYDLLAHTLKAPLRRLHNLDGQREVTEKFWALQDVNFEVQPGEVVGVIGRNGAGKSTLLKILSRITDPTRGRIEVRGRLASLLEVGTGFHPELSGRENIYLNGAILGMTRKEVARKFDEIIAFAEIDRFIDTPVKRYSSGMYVRLAFAVAAHLEVDVLVVDEVLAVGDAAFQEKCLSKMGEVSEGGRTVLFVSHNLGAISRLCQRAVLLGEGKILFDGFADDAILAYSKRLPSLSEIDHKEFFGDLTSKLVISKLEVNDSSESQNWIFLPNQHLVFKITGMASQLIEKMRLTLSLRKNGQLIISLHDLALPADLAPGVFASTFTLPDFFLSHGQYTVEVGAYSITTKEWMWSRHLGLLSITNKWFEQYDTDSNMGLVNLPACGHRTSIFL